MKLRLLPGVLLLAALLPGDARGGEAGDAWPFPANAAGVVSLDDESRIGIANSHAGILFRKKDGALIGIWRHGDGNLLSPRPAVPLWSLELKPVGTGKPAVLGADVGSDVSFTISGDRRQRNLRAFYKTSAGTVTTTVILAADLELPLWGIEVKLSRAGDSLWSVSFPQIAIAAFEPEPAANEMVVPYRRGQLRIFGSAAPRGDTDLPYPGPAAKFQFVAAYGKKNGRGFYCGVEDAEGYTKALQQRNYPGDNAVVLATQHFPAGRGGEVRDFRLPYEISAGPFTGDWWDAARIYRKWWVQQTWASKGLLADRRDIPEWLKHAAIAIRPSTTKPERTVANNVANMAALRGMFAAAPMVGTWYGYSQAPAGASDSNEGGHGHALPLKPGAADAIRDAKTQGIHLQAYIQSMIYDVSISADESAEAVRAVTKDSKSQQVFYGDGKDKRLSSMCRATDWWQSRLVSLSRRAVGEFGFSGVYLDSFGKGAPECFADTHGHPIGGGNTVIAGQRAMAQRIRTAIREVNPEAIMSGEDPVEAFRDLLDVNLYAVNVTANYAPVFRTVWGDYSLGHGRVLRPGKDDGPLIPELAVLFTEGTIPGRIYCDSPAAFLTSPERKSDLAFLKSATRYTESGMQYLRFGELLHPLKLTSEPPVVEFRESVENQVVRLPSVIHCVTRSHADGSVAIVLVNIATTSQTIAVPINPDLLGHRGDEASLLRMDEAGRLSPLASGRAAWQQKLTLEPGAIAFLILK